jgi:hypothetical protein
LTFIDRVNEGMARWAKYVLVVIAVVIVLVVAALLGAAFLPRWWAHRIGAQGDGGFVLSILLGLFYGFVFTVLPVAVLRFAFDKRRAVKTWAWMFGLAILLALPNLLTVGIVLGTGRAAHAGERTLDVEAPGFRGASLGGAIAALCVFALWEYLRYSRGRARSEVRRLRAEAREAKKQQSSSP